MPNYRFTWRTIQVEPVPFSGERISVGAIMKDGTQIVAGRAILSKAELEELYGDTYGARIWDGVSRCLESEKVFYSKKPLFVDWEPPLSGFYLTPVQASMGENTEDAFHLIASKASSFKASLLVEKA